MGMQHQPEEQCHPNFWFGLQGFVIHQDREYKSNTFKGKMRSVLSLLQVPGKQSSEDYQ